MTKIYKTIYGPNGIVIQGPTPVTPATPIPANAPQWIRDAMSRQPRQPQPQQPIPVPPWGGVGSEMKALLHSVWPARPCDACNQFARKMDEKGIEWCKTEGREEILRHLRKQAANRGWFQKLGMAAMAIGTGLAFKIDPTNPVEGILQESIRLAEAKKSAWEAKQADAVKEEGKANEHATANTAPTAAAADTSHPDVTQGADGGTLERQGGEKTV